MTNAELMATLRYCAESTNIVERCDIADCPYHSHRWSCIDDMLRAAADALEAAEKRIAELSLDNKMLKNTIDADKGVMLDRIRFLEAQIPEEGEWVWENYCWHCSVCGENPTRGMGYVQGKSELFRVCPNCGAKMANEQKRNEEILFGGIENV